VYLCACVCVCMCARAHECGQLNDLSKRIKQNIELSWPISIITCLALLPYTGTVRDTVRAHTSVYIRIHKQ